MKSIASAIVALVVVLAASAVSCAEPAATRRIDPAALAPIDQIVSHEIRAGRIPGAVVLIGNHASIVYQRAFGYRRLAPKPVAMTTDTVFDLASLTKVIATATAIMQLAANGKLRLDDPIAKYWPQFARNGKASITVREALTHYSGLPPDLDLRSRWTGYHGAIWQIVAARPGSAAGTRYIYSDVNFEILGELVRRISGEPLDVYCRRHIFGPLGMKDTGFRPPRSERDRIAPTENTGGSLRWGDVHDPTAYRMGGVAGHAGLFSTAGDLAIFARMMLGGGIANGVRVLDAASIDQMTGPESPQSSPQLRGLGWEIGAPFGSNREQLLPLGSYGHSGYTGTFLWIDPLSDTYVIILSNRVYPDGKGDARPLRREIMTLVSDAAGPVTQAEVVAKMPRVAAYEEAIRSASNPSLARVATGADVLAGEGLAPITGLRVGLITNRSAVDSAGVTTIDVLRGDPNVKLAALFSPEHGLYANLDEKVASGSDPATNLPVFSLYGGFRRPTDQMLDGIDALVFDVQDAGARFYTYATTMAYAMEAAARKGIDFYVLDRPDPITASIVEGPVLDRDLISFAGYFPMPVRHGMTIGELARMFNAENRIGAKLHVIAMRGYQRRQWYDQTGLRWIPPSPNLRTLDEATLYPGVAMAEGANLSVGRGTDTPFEVIGAPWIDAGELALYLNRRNVCAVRFAPADFTPRSDRYAGRLCHGVQISITDRQSLDTSALGVEILSALKRLYAGHFQLGSTLAMVGSRSAMREIEDGEDPRLVERGWQSRLEGFRTTRDRYLLY